MWFSHIIFILFCISTANAEELFSASVEKIIDGDSLLVTTEHNTLEVRLYGVDCPEYNQPFSKEAKNFIKKKVLGKKVSIEPVYHDSYGRLVAVVRRDKKVVNKDMIQAGLAWVHPRYCKKAFCSSWKESERRAQEEKKGLWQDLRPDPPWQWKAMESRNKD